MFNPGLAERIVGGVAGGELWGEEGIMMGRSALPSHVLMPPVDSKPIARVLLPGGVLVDPKVATVSAETVPSASGFDMAWLRDFH